MARRGSRWHARAASLGRRLLGRTAPEPGDDQRRRVDEMEGGPAVPTEYEIAVDYTDMTNDRRFWVLAADVRAGLELSVGRHVVVGDEDADSKVARIVAVDADGNVQVEILPGSVESNSDPLAPA